jgi:histidinol dehydrogenase
VSVPIFRFTGALDALAPGERRALVGRGASPACDAALRRRTAEILERVRAEGDAALRALARELDGVELDALEVARPVRRAALDALDPALRRALERAAANVATAHRAQRPVAVEVVTEPGVLVGRRPDPLARVGAYAPGGLAAYPSSVLMGVVPARVAGVGEVVLCSPPGPDGLPSAVVLAAAELAGVDRVFALGGAGAIAAMAYGTASVPRVDRIVGPGNAWVAEAKLQVSGVVSIDAPAGPSELLVIADERARPDAIAREIVAQAEHDPRAAVAVLVLGGDAVAARLAAAVREALATAPRRDVIAEALATRGALLSARSLDEALAFASEYAAEHLLLAVADPDAALAGVRCTGTVFLGEASSVAFGDYATGANHVLPTGGLARSWSGLSTHDFVRWTTWQRVEPAAAARLAADVATLAEAERLPGHAAAARAWAEPQGGTPPAPPRSRALARAAYRDISRYSPERASCPVDLSDNTSAWGAPPAASRALLDAAASAEAVARYPSLDAEATTAAMAAYLGVDAARIVTGCGSDDVLDSAIRAFGEPGDRLAHLDPTFSMIPIFARLNGLEPVAVPLTATFDADPDAVLATGARIIYLCSPNNPTGTALSRAAVERIVDRAPGLVILDGAYAEFAAESDVDLLARSPRLLVTRTLSKAFGLAGLRVGYAAGAPDVVAEVAKSRGPYKVGALAERAARAALTEDLPWVRAVVAETVVLRARLAAALGELGLAPLPSAANFVLVPVPGAAAVAARMRARGVAVRAFTALGGVGDALRIAVAPWPALEACLDALRGALAEARR